jgi:hypothetical protein
MWTISNNHAHTRYLPNSYSIIHGTPHINPQYKSDMDTNPNAYANLAPAARRNCG